MTKKQWIAIAWDALIRSGMKQEEANLIAGKPSVKQKCIAYERLNYLEFQIENRKTK